MNQFEKDLQHTLQNEPVPGPDSERLWSLIQENRFRRKGRNNVNLIRRMAVTASVCFAIAVAISSYGNEIALAASTLFSQVFGSLEEVKQLDPHADQQVMEDDLAVVQKVLTENEFRQYTALIKERVNIMKKAIEVVGGEQKIYMDRLTEEEKQRLNQNENQLRPLINKIDQFISSIDETAKKLPFPVKRPEYVPLGYTLVKEEAKSARTTGTQEPVISFSYKQIDGEFGFMITQSEVLTGENDEYSRWKPEQEVTYDLHGNKVHYGKFGKNVTLMKVVVPEKDSTPSYQVFIIADILSKQELEKIALSMIE